MKKLITLSILTICSLLASTASAKQVAYWPFEVTNGKITETVSGKSTNVKGSFAPESVPGVKGNALALDGYTSYISTSISDLITDGNACTVSVWVALEAYPVVDTDKQTAEKVNIVSCLNESSASGFAFKVGQDGSVTFETYLAGWPMTLSSSEKLPLAQWCNLTATLDSTNKKAYLYLNGKQVANARCNSAVNVKAGTLLISKNPTDKYSGTFRLTSIRGLIDELSVWDEVKTPDEIASWKADNPADLSVPASRFANDLLRPRYHGMPGANWTNETHGLIYSNGKYHLFFQKNANGPYMARLHWGHLSSANLYDWHEEPIAIAPGESYDTKGCWSGCVFTDPQVTGGKPGLIYTAVDYGRAVIAQATADDNDLIGWTKRTDNPVINGRPSGLSDDFRDPYFFRANGNAYIIVGTAKNGVGATTLHRYDPSAGTWSNDGSLFFSGRSESQHGRFWEMPNVTLMENGQYLFTVTPQGSSLGTRALYWTGSILSNGQFSPNSNNAAAVDMASKHGLGLLSPSICQYGGKTIAMGIVPDVLPSGDNASQGWAHTYSLPREWTLTADGQLVQKPFEGLQGLRTQTTFSRSNFTIDGDIDLTPVTGRQVELLGRFTVGENPVGFRFFKSGNGEATVTYWPDANEVEVDFSQLNRKINDSGVFNGSYSCALPEALPKGSELKLNLFIDGSIVDLFINDKWATSIRVFPKDAAANGVEAFSEGPAHVKSVNAWVLDAKNGTGAVEIVEADRPDDADSPARYFNLQGVEVSEPHDGIFIKVQGSKATKVIM